ncbi:O-antigen ligase family protein [Neptuniibacter sp. PT8_73]|uniref:O-antigen ligase family protein n=1 Tax=unclassified Neptuniibacter TaxID=2630693 RepID=UPI0039F6A536
MFIEERYRLFVPLMLLALCFFDAMSRVLMLAPFEVLFLLLLMMPLFVKVDWNGVVFYTLFLFLFVSLCSFVVSYENTGIYGFKYWFGQYAFRIGVVFVVVWLYLYRFFQIDDIARSMFWVNLLVSLTGITLMALFSDLQFFRNGVYRLDEGFKGIIDLTAYYNPNVISRYLILTAPLALYYSYRKSLFMTLLLIASNFAVIYSAGSRMAVLCIFLMFVLFMIFSKLKMSTKGVIFLIFTVFVFASFDRFYERMERKMEQVSEHGSSIRLAMLDATLDAVEKQPVLGYGPGMAKEVVNSDPEFISVYETLFPGNEHAIALHNTSMLVVLDLGLIALFVFNFLFLLLIYILYRQYRLYGDGMLLACLISVLGVYLMGFTSVSLGENIGWLIIGFAVCCIKSKGAQKENYSV